MRRLGKGGGFRQWRRKTTLRCFLGLSKYMVRNRYRYGKLRLRDLRRRWRYPTAGSREIRPRRQPRDYRRIRPTAAALLLPTLPVLLRRPTPPPAAVLLRHPTHRLTRIRAEKILWYYWWRQDPKWGWSRKIRKCPLWGRKRRKQRVRVPKVIRRRLDYRQEKWRRHK